MGSILEVELGLEDGTSLTAMMPAGAIAVAEGEEVFASWKPDAAIFVRPREGSHP